MQTPDMQSVSPQMAVSDQPLTSSQYEFTSAQNDTITNLASKMNLVAIFTIAIGILNAVVNLVQGRIGTIAIGLIYGAIFVLIGFWTVSAARAFRKIVDTQGSDINHLMEALENMRRMYHFQFWVILIAMILILIAVGVLIGNLGNPEPL